MTIDNSSLKKLADSKATENKKFFQRLQRTKPRQLDELVHELHDEQFAHIDCLQCANCCKTTSPIFRQKDIERLAGLFRMRPADFIATYLHIDTDGDHVLNVAPCPFLLPDNHCSVYDHRPAACRQYPHTDQRKIHTILNETYHNIAVCPAVFHIVEKLKTMI